MVLTISNMKKTVLCLLIFVVYIGIPTNASAQKHEIQQLLLNIQKLAQFKQILKDLKKGYEIIHKGYSTIKNLSEGNFNLHKTFLDGLLQVSPTVKNYQRVSDIINYQIIILKEYKNAYNRFKKDGNFTLEEIEYIDHVYDNLFEQSLNNLGDLTIIVTANKLRMTDYERLKAIDQIFAEMEDKLLFLRNFNKSTTILALQRASEQNDLATMQRIYGITK